MSGIRFGLDPDTAPTAEEARLVKDAIQICGSPKRAALALMRVAESLANDLAMAQRLRGKPLPDDVFYAAPNDEIRHGEHILAVDPKH
ncbi:hypothetical protein AB4037_17850 [Labrys sp. KB_33_2]|uniref:hypothetical protein n=1 Tax=Labrys sp. KB_33_2 TaxID=3237479 RepID=UPI003F8FB0B5